MEQNHLSKRERIEKFGEVFTPQHIVEDMLNLLEANDPDIFSPEKTYLEPACGDGVFVCEILRRKFARCKRRADYTTAISSVYAMEIQEDNVRKTIENVTALCREYFHPTKKELTIIEDHIIQADALKVMKMINEMGERDGS